jgi:hypothetical protein
MLDLGLRLLLLLRERMSVSECVIEYGVWRLGRVTKERIKNDIGMERK